MCTPMLGSSWAKVPPQSLHSCNEFHDTESDVPPKPPNSPRGLSHRYLRYRVLSRRNYLMLYKDDYSTQIKAYECWNVFFFFSVWILWCLMRNKRPMKVSIKVYYIPDTVSSVWKDSTKKGTASALWKFIIWLRRQDSCTWNSWGTWDMI